MKALLKNNFFDNIYLSVLWHLVHDFFAVSHHELSEVAREAAAAGAAAARGGGGGLGNKVFVYPLISPKLLHGFRTNLEEDGCWGGGGGRGTLLVYSSKTYTGSTNNNNFF